MISSEKIALIKLIRPNQWIKNFILFSTVIFNGKLFDPIYLLATLSGFIIFCALSSASYIFNDIIDLKNDRKHPVKKNRPLASGQIKLNTASEIAFILGFFGLIASLVISPSFFFIAAAFVLLHIFYTLFFKNYSILDILSIAFSFILRAYAGEMITGYHLPFWFFLTILFVALFVATTKRHAELLRTGKKSRPALFQYQERLLDSYTSMFGSASIIAYSLFTFLEEPPRFNPPLREFLSLALPQAIDRKWMIVTIPFVMYGLMRYAQLAYEGTQGEQPEKIITSDIPLIVSMLSWGIAIILVLYIL
jgi:decaprenyl-phosphate phosphoribosyltransferase